MNLPFRAVEHPQLRRAFRIARPSIDIPGRKRIKLLLEERYAKLTENLLDDLGSETKVSLALDCWTSPNHHAFMAITAYYITADWKLREVLLAFELLQGQHSGRNLAIIVSRVLQQHRLTHRLYALTADNATNNDTLCVELSEVLAAFNVEWRSSAMHVRCLAHIIQLACNALLDDIKGSATNEQRTSVWEESQLDGLAGVVSFPRTLFKVRGRRNERGVTSGCVIAQTNSVFSFEKSRSQSTAPHKG